MSATEDTSDKIPDGQRFINFILFSFIALMIVLMFVMCWRLETRIVILEKQAEQSEKLR